MNSRTVLAALVWGMLFSISPPRRVPLPAAVAATWGVDPEIRPYVQLFYEGADKYGDHVVPYYNPVYFIEGYDDDVVGMCGTSIQYSMIEISREFWDASSVTVREILVLHELSHCILNQDHRDFGLMRPYLLDPALYLRYHEFFLWELFSAAPQVSPKYADE